VEKLPFEEDKRILNNLGVTNTGLRDSHKQMSNTKIMYSEIDRVVKKHNEIRARRKRKLKDAEKKNELTAEPTKAKINKSEDDGKTG